MSDSASNSYGQILKASSIMGGAAGINLLLGMVRVKFAAVLIGTTGVGLNASFTAIQGLIGTLAGLGIQSSGVREIAAAVGTGDQAAIGRTILTLRRICWLTGLLGMTGMMLLSPLLSQLTFGHRDYALDIAALGIIILFGNLSGGQMALIQGTRRIGDMARANIYGAAAGIVAAIGFYAALGLRGIVPTLVAVSAIQLALSFHFARRVPVPKVALTWRQTFAEAGGMVKLGAAIMWNGLAGSVVAYVTVTLITQQEGTQAVGLYSAALALSSIFVNFVLGALAADYYPRLTAVSSDNAVMSRLINEQTEVGLLLATPGLVATITFAPWILQIFYTREFSGAAELMQWLILGCAGRVLSWPMSYATLALGRARWHLSVELGFQLLEIVLIAILLQQCGLEGVAITFFVKYVIYIIAIRKVSHHLMGFMWSKDSIKLILGTMTIISLTFLSSRFLPSTLAYLSGSALTILTMVYCLRGLVARIGEEHKLSRIASKIPSLTLKKT